MSFDELKMIQSLKSGDKRAFRELVEATQDHIYNTSFSFVKNKEDAEDIAQQVYMEVLKNIHKFREDAKLSTWMYRIAVNCSLNLIKSKKRHERVQSLDEMMVSTHAQDIPAYEESSDQEELLYRRRMAILQLAIQYLPENQRIAINLNKFETLSYEEVAEIMGLSISAVSALINRGKVNLKKKVSILYKKYEKKEQGFYTFICLKDESIGKNMEKKINTHIDNDLKEIFDLLEDVPQQKVRHGFYDRLNYRMEHSEEESQEVHTTAVGRILRFAATPALAAACIVFGIFIGLDRSETTQSSDLDIMVETYILTVSETPQLFDIAGK